MNTLDKCTLKQQMLYIIPNSQSLQVYLPREGFSWLIRLLKLLHSTSWKNTVGTFPWKGHVAIAAFKGSLLTRHWLQHIVFIILLPMSINTRSHRDEFLVESLEIDGPTRGSRCSRRLQDSIMTTKELEQAYEFQIAIAIQHVFLILIRINYYLYFFLLYVLIVHRVQSKCLRITCT